MSKQPATALKPMEQSSPIQFVQDLEVASDIVPASDPIKPDVVGKLPPSHKPQGYVEAESSISFTNMLTGQNKADVLNSTLLAKLAANMKYNYKEQPLEWYGFYKNVLQQVGWVIQDFCFQKYKTSSSSFTMDKAIHEVLAPIANTDEAVVVERSLKALQSLPHDDHRVSLFYKYSSKSKSANFQFQLCTKGDNGQVVMVLGSFYFKSKVEFTRFLFKEFHSKDVDLEYAAQTVTLNAAAYEAVRAEIVEKLSKYPNSFKVLF